MIASSTNSSTTYESINHSATAGTYKLRVVGNAGAFNDVQCYSLYASFYGNACGRPDNVTSTAITYNSATINWPAVLSATSYELRWKPTAGSTWTTVSGIPTNSYGLIALSPLTGYDAQVRSICAGGTQDGSEFTQTHAFTTLSAPCEVSPPILIAAKLFLEGPYKLGRRADDGFVAQAGLVALERALRRPGLQHHRSERHDHPAFSPPRATTPSSIGCSWSCVMRPPEQRSLSARRRWCSAMGMSPPRTV